uniref:Ion_trans_2 domain-containing protein n=1 Tax=Ascaris lumbricoides TaxID=6252 RepID=A0A0M3I1D2_ASCLU
MWPGCEHKLLCAVSHPVHREGTDRNHHSRGASIVLIDTHMVTVGFGDLVPVGGEHYVAASILFIFIGLVLTTLAVDLIGSSCIERIHAWGRGLDALNLLNALRNHKNQCWFAYVPKDAHLIPFIDCTDTSNKD